MKIDCISNPLFVKFYFHNDAASGSDSRTKGKPRQLAPTGSNVFEKQVLPDTLLP
jgi:hypothetical protein